MAFALKAETAREMEPDEKLLAEKRDKSSGDAADGEAEDRVSEKPRRTAPAL